MSIRMCFATSEFKASYFTIGFPFLSTLGFLFLMSCGGCNTDQNQFQGTVVDDATGLPIANARISMKMRYHGPGSPENEAFETTTDQGGRYQFPAIAVPDDEFRLMRTQLAFCVTKEGYDCTRADFSRSSDIHEQLDFRLEPDRNIELPAGTLRIPRDSEPRLSELNEPSYGFVFLNNQLEFAELDQESDFELHYAFVANGESNEDNLLGSTTPSKSGQAQFLASVHASKDRIGQVRYTRVLGHPPRMPAINAIKFNSVFSFHQPMEIGTMFLTSNEFLLKTRSGNYALLHFEMDRVSWVYQPDGSLDISRKRRK